MLNRQRDPRKKLTPLRLRLTHHLHRRRIRLQPNPILSTTHPLLPHRRSLRSIRIRIIRADKTGPVPLHHRHDVLIRRRVTRRRGDVCRSPDGGHFRCVGDAEPRGNLVWVEDVVAVVPDEGLVLRGEDVAELDAWADVARFAVGPADVVPIWRWGLGVKAIKGSVVREEGGGECGKLIAEEVFGLGEGGDGLRGEDGAFVGVVAGGRGQFDF